jgi:hypothetical protein
MTTDPELQALRREWQEQLVAKKRLSRRLSTRSADRRPVAVTIVVALLLAGAFGAAAAGSHLETVIVLECMALLMLALWLLSNLHWNEAGGAAAESSAVSTYIACAARRRRADVRRLAVAIAAHAAVLAIGGAWLVWRVTGGLTLSQAFASAPVGSVMLLLVIVSLAVLAERIAEVRRELAVFTSLLRDFDKDDVDRQAPPRESWFRSRRRKGWKTL